VRSSLAAAAIRTYDGLARTSPRDSQQLVDSLLRQLAPAVKAGIAAAIVIAALALAPAPAVARHLDCGDRVTSDVRLDSDLLNCPGNGLTVGADGITIDLGGHVVDGSGRGFGILNGQWGDGHRDVAIRNGTVRGFRVGVRSGARGTRVSGLTVTRNAAGGIALRSRDCRVDRNVVISNAYGHGIFVGGVSNCRIVGNRVAGQLGAGIEVSRSRGHVIERNRVWDNRQAGILLAGTAGVRVARNTVYGNAGPGLWLFDGTTSTDVLANTFAANESGIAVTLGGATNRITGNSVSGSRKSGIRLVETGAGNTVTANMVVLSAGDGIAVRESPGALLERNGAHDNGDDGIDVEDDQVGLVANITAGNGDLGIETPADGHP
jgi:parallel beta-helix repeat protein